MARIAALHIYPIKSCAGLGVDSSAVGLAGLAHDREWMVADALTGRFVTQRDAPRLALVRPTIEPAYLTLYAGGLTPLAVPLERTGDHLPVEIWGHHCEAFDAGAQAAEWLSVHLRRAVRLVRFDPAHRRRSNLDWTAGTEALNRFTDGYPILVLSSASLDALNARLGSPLPMNRFRPNVVIDGVEAHDEDRWTAITAGAVTLRIVKPCTRCEITTTDQTTAERAAEPLATLATYRADPRMQGGITFGQNAILAAGDGATLSVGMVVEVEWNF